MSPQIRNFDVQRHLVTSLGQALSAARYDEVCAIARVLSVVIEATGAREARLHLLQGPTVEVWRLEEDGEVTLAVALDGADDGFAQWRSDVTAEGSHAVLAAALPVAPGVDAGLLAVDVLRDPATTHDAALQLDELALHAASVAAMSRADVERRIAVSAATNDDKLMKARTQAELLRQRAQWAMQSVNLVERDATFSQDAAAHLTALTSLLDTLLQDLTTT